MRILITGGTGFVGVHLGAHLATKHEVYSLVRQGGSAQGRLRYQRCDLAAAMAIERFPSHVDAVVHLAQSRRGREFPEGAADMFAVNIGSTQSLLQYALRERVKHFVLASTGSVYPVLESLLSGNSDGRCEAAPTNYYAVSKLAAELLTRPYQRFMHVCALRLFTPYGPGQSDRLVSDLIDRVVNERPVTLVGQHDGLKFYPTYIADVISVIERALDEHWDGTYDVANAQAVSVRQAAEQIGAVIQKKPTFERRSGPEQPILLPNLGALRSRFPTANFWPFELGVRATLNQSRQALRQNE